MLKAITKAKRRATLSLCGLGMLDEASGVERILPGLDLRAPSVGRFGGGSGGVVNVYVTQPLGSPGQIGQAVLGALDSVAARGFAIPGRVGASGGVRMAGAA